MQVLNACCRTDRLWWQDDVRWPHGEPERQRIGDGQMRTIVLGGKALEIDEDGFLQQPDAWDKKVARDLARLEGIEVLSADHWIVIQYIRDYFLRFGVAPLVRRLCKETGKDIDEIYALFPSGPADGACKIAGLPTPTGCT